MAAADVREAVKQTVDQLTDEQLARLQVLIDEMLETASPVDQQNAFFQDLLKFRERNPLKITIEEAIAFKNEGRR